MRGEASSQVWENNQPLAARRGCSGVLDETVIEVFAGIVINRIKIIIGDLRPVIMRSGRP